MTAIQCTEACRHGQDHPLKSKPCTSIGKTIYLSGSKCGVVVDATHAGLSISETVYLYKLTSLGFTGNVLRAKMLS